MATSNDANELVEYFRHESSRNDGESSSSEEEMIVRRHALEQLVESTLGADITAAARRLVANEDGSSSRELAEDNEIFCRNAANELMGSPSFRLVQDAVEECSFQLPAAAPSSTAGKEDDKVVANNKKAKIPESSTPSAAPASFSLFDMMDSQKGAFALPPRIMAYQIIETYQREKNSTVGGDDVATTTTPDDGKSTLELLEKANDVEDLSPDPDSWDEVRQILYDGLTNSINPDDASRYLKVHKSLFEKCRGDNACSSQLWGLAQNLVGSILTFPRQFEEEESVSTRYSMDLCWDIAQSLLDALSDLAVDYITSCVGNEGEIERMFLGICTILSDDSLACIMGMMEPMAGWFEVWARFVDPSKFMTIIHVSGMGGVVLRRCECLGRNTSSESISKIIQKAGSGEIEHCNFLQSLSIIRTILFRCGGSREVVSMIHHQYSIGSKSSTALNSFLLPHGVISLDDMQTLLKLAEEGRKQRIDTQHMGTHDEVNAVLKPFRGVIQVKESNARMVDYDLEVLCTQTIQLIQQ